MNRNAFKEKIKSKLKKLNTDQYLKFAWICSVRALPFLGNSGNFNFWKKEKMQKHIYSIFYAIDSSAYTAANVSSVYGVTDTAAYAVAYDAASAATAAAVAYDAAHSAADVVATDAAHSAADVVATDAAHSAAYTAASAAYAAAYVSSFTYTIAKAYAAAAAADAYGASVFNAEGIYESFSSIILQDLITLQENGKELVSAESYGKIWENFQKALKVEGCTYWGDLYKCIFDDDFVLDKKALERRMNVPAEIREQGAASVANYLIALEKGATRLNEARIIVLGDKGAGKTCIARRLIDPDAPMTADDESTAGVDTMLWKLENENMKVRIWDFAGHTVTHAVHQLFLSERCLYLMVYDGRTEDRNRIKYWLDHMKNYGGDSQAIILVNERDQHRVNIPINFLREKYSIAEVYTFSIQDNKKGLKAFRNDVAAYIKNNPSWEKQEIPKNYYEVKEDLEDLFIKNKKEKGLEYITKEKFEELADAHGVDDKEKLLKDLHSLGVTLWYQHMEDFNMLILNPEWISHGVYKIINWVNEQKRYELILDDFVKAFEDDAIRYPASRHGFIFNLMKYYELAYEIEAEKRLIIPHLLKEDRPAKIPDFPVGESLMLRYKAEQPLPPNTISRFIIRHNQEIRQEIRQEKKIYFGWRYGAVLEDGKGSIAMVRENDRTISVSVKGKDKTNYISLLRETLNDIFSSYKSQKPELHYKIDRFGQIPDEIDIKNDLWLLDEKIYNHYERQKPYYDDYTDRDIPMAGVVNNFNIKAENIISGGQGHRIIKTTFNFRDCNIGLQGNLNELALLLSQGGNKTEAKELENAAKSLEKAEKFKSQEEVKKKGIANMLNRLVVDLGEKDSKLHKTVKGIKHGISIGQDIAKGYNDLAQWMGLPHVPKPFLK